MMKIENIESYIQDLQEEGYTAILRCEIRDGKWIAEIVDAFNTRIGTLLDRHGDRFMHAEADTLDAALYDLNFLAA